jgi:hypothetical protein
LNKYWESSLKNGKSYFLINVEKSEKNFKKLIFKKWYKNENKILINW